LGGNYDNRFDRRYSLSPPVQPEIGKGKPESLSKLLKEYVEETAGSGKWIPKSRAEAEAIYNLFLRIVGDRDVRTLDHRVVVEYREILRKLPSNMNKSPLYRGKTISELLAMKVEKPLSETSVNKHITLVGAFLKWAVRQSHIEANYIEGLTIARKAAKESEEREAYSSDDIGKLLASPLYVDTSRARGSYQKHPEHYWIPLIGLFSGMRLNEICQLHVEDIEEIDGVFCFSINAEGTKRLKNLSSRRVVPIHPELIRLGLVRYVSRVRGEGASRFWMNLEGKRDGHGQDMSKWYQRFNRKNITTNPKRVFHSFRHCVGNDLKQRKVEGSIISELLGHSQTSITLGRYGKSYEPQVLLEALMTLDYGVSDALARLPLFEP
jgi:integrase